jgi:hypothetical protein
MRDASSIRVAVVVAGAAWLVTLEMVPLSGRAQTTPPPTHAALLFQTSNECVACHNGLTAPSGEDVSIGVSWRSSMMANSGRDPYWIASVRREIADHPTRRADIEDECSICHMPMARAVAAASGRKGEIFSHLPAGRTDGEEDRLAADGVSCTLCHQIDSERLGTPESFTGRFVLRAPVAGERQMLGPFDVKPGHTTIMRSATGFRPAEASHLRNAELCATCHTLITHAFGRNGEVIGRLPEQVPFQEWQHSAFSREKTCQQCHMPTVEQPTPITSVFGEPREGLGRHTFVGGNFFMLRVLNRHRDDLGVRALPQEMEAAARATIRQLQTDTASVTLERAERSGDRLTFDVQVTNRAGHKLPTGYPARRAWLHVTVRDRDGRAVFESGALSPTGAIRGNDSDTDASRFEAHHEVIRSNNDVQVYESVMGDVNGVPTTGLLSAVRFLKDNRLLPRGFDKATAADDIAVRGEASRDADFGGGGDRVRFDTGLGGTDGPFLVEAVLLYQPIAFRWAHNLASYDAPEARRFLSYFDQAASSSAVAVATSSARVD